MQELLKISDLIKIRYVAGNTTSERIRDFCYRLGSGRVTHPMAFKVLQNAYEKLRSRLRGKYNYYFDY